MSAAEQKPAEQSAPAAVAPDTVSTPEPAAAENATTAAAPSETPATPAAPAAPESLGTPDAPATTQASSEDPAPTETQEATKTQEATGTKEATETKEVTKTKEATEIKQATETKEPAVEKAPVDEKTPITQLWAAAKATGHPEVWGVTLTDPETHVPTQIVLQKYLNANDGDVDKAKDQLTKTLEWRAKTKPLELVKKAFSKTKFDGLGYVTKYLQEGSTEPEGKEVFTWNIYGGVTSIDETFGKLEEFLDWRVALMELALQELDLASATKAITAEYDPYKIFQVHDYKSISFLRQSPQVKSASAETIKVFAQNYPELLKEKFFVNVPAIMGFVYAFMKLFVAPKTIKKFHPMSNGGNLAVEFAESKVAALGEKLPANYGGKGVELEAQGKGPLLE